MARSARSKFRQIDASRALKAAVAAGLIPQSYRISPEGEIVVHLVSGADKSENSFDELMRGKGEV